MSFHSFMRVTRSFLSLNNSPLYGKTMVCLTIHQLTDMWAGSTFWLQWRVLLCTFLSKSGDGSVSSFLLGGFPEVELLGHGVRLWLIFWGNARLLYKGLCHSMFPPAACECSDFSASSPALICLLDQGHLHGSNLYFPTELIMLSIFSWSYWPLGYVLWETVYSNLLLIFQLDCLFLMEVLSIFTYTRYRFLTRHVICNELLPSINYLFTLFFFLLHFFF